MEVSVKVVEITGIDDGRPLVTFRISDEDGGNPDFEVSQPIPTESVPGTNQEWVSVAQRILAARLGKASSTLSLHRDYGRLG